MNPARGKVWEPFIGAFVFGGRIHSVPLKVMQVVAVLPSGCCHWLAPVITSNENKCLVALDQKASISIFAFIIICPGDLFVQAVYTHGFKWASYPRN